MATGPEAPPLPPCFGGGKRLPGRMKPVREEQRAEGCRRGPEVMTDETTELIPSVGPCFDRACDAEGDA